MSRINPFIRKRWRSGQEKEEDKDEQEEEEEGYIRSSEADFVSWRLLRTTSCMEGSHSRSIGSARLRQTFSFQGVNLILGSRLGLSI